MYLDYAATTPLDSTVLEQMMPYFHDEFGNASSQHAFGRKAIAAVDRAREQIASVLGASAGEIYFTSGGTESDNWAIRGVAKSYREKGKHIITSSVEHHAVLNTLKFLEEEGFEVTYLPVDEKGRVSVEDVVRTIREDTILVTVMLANNEVGTIEPIEKIARVAREKGVLMHTDAVQAVGILPVKIADLGVDFLSLSGHKFYGPKGVGVLYVRKGVKLGRILTGGAQERTMRGGTYNTPGIVGIGAALELAEKTREDTKKKCSDLRDYFLSEIRSVIPDVILNGTDGEDRLPNNLHVSFANVDGEALLRILDRAGIAASAGSACASGTLEESHVLTAMGISKDLAKSSIRFSVGKQTTREDIDYTVSVLVDAVGRLRSQTLFLQGKAISTDI